MKIKGDFKVFLIAYHNEVTGSRFLLVIMFPDGSVRRILIDCGYFQELRHRHLNYVDDIDPKNIDSILITHNHIDHTGLLPKMVKLGYHNPIYMTEITKELIPRFLLDCYEQQDDNAIFLKQKYPQDAWRFESLYKKEDVKSTLKLCRGVEFFKAFEVAPGVNIRYLENGHQLGAGMIFVECSYPGRKPLNFLFTGDYKLTNAFFKVTPIPNWIKNKELIVINESTYGTTSSLDVEKCFASNLLEAFSKKQHILIGCFAQARFQEMLFDLKKMQDANLIPPEYSICIDGTLGVDTTEKYKKILEWYNPQCKDFMPNGVTVVDAKSRTSILDSGGPKIIITTSGMLSNGPARIYVPMFIGREDCMIHIVGYAAEQTLARTLIEAKDMDTIMIGKETYKKRATVKVTSEKSSHATMDEMLNFIKSFKNVRFLALNHGEEFVQESFLNQIVDVCDNVEDADLINRQNMYCFIQYGLSGERYSNLVVKKMPAKLTIDSPKTNKKYKEVIALRKKDKKAKKSNQEKRFKNRRNKKSKRR